MTASIDRRTLCTGVASSLALAGIAQPARSIEGQTNRARLSPELWRSIKAISNVFEVGKPEPDYAYVEALGDGRGYTVTQYGFCTYNDEVSAVIKRIAATRPSTSLARFLSYLPAADPEIAQAPWPAFPAAWRAEALEASVLSDACEAEAEIRIVSPSIRFAEKSKVSSPAGFCIFYDTLLQHGFAGDGDSIQAIAERTAASLKPGSSEEDFLAQFLDVRRDVLLASANKETREAWREAAGRVDALRAILLENPQLKRPIIVRNEWGNVTIP